MNETEQNDAFERRIAEALKAPAMQRHLPNGFTYRFAAEVARQRNGLPRWAKIAAALALMASLVSFAAWLGEVPVESAPSAGSDAETISNPGGDTMTARKMTALVGAAMLSAAVQAKTSADYADGETMLYIPFDSDCLSVVNKECNPQSVQSFSGTGGSVSFTHPTGGALVVNDSRVFIDISDFGFDDELDSATIEFAVKGKITANVWPLLFTIGTMAPDKVGLDSSFDNSYPILLQNASGVFAIRVDSAPRTPKANTSGNGTGFDGEWHHIALTVAPVYTSGQLTGSKIKIYVDRTEVQSVDFAVPWTGRTAKNGKRTYLALGSPAISGTSFNIAFDDIRITKGVLSTDQFFQDAGETLLYMTFDDIMASIAHGTDGPLVGSGTPTYAGKTWKHSVIDAGRTTTIRDENSNSLKVSGSTGVTLTLPYWALSRRALDSATIEFFIKGEADATPTPWCKVLGIWNTPSPVMFPFLVQINGAGQYYLRADGYEKRAGAQTTAKEEAQAAVAPGKANDGKWHHVAFTVKPNGDGTSEIEIFFDYESMSKGSTTNFGWRGVADNMILGFGDGLTDGTFCVDELRISRGVLDSAKFLKAGSIGLTLFLR